VSGLMCPRRSCCGPDMVFMLAPFGHRVDAGRWWGLYRVSSFHLRHGMSRPTNSMAVGIETVGRLGDAHNSTRVVAGLDVLLDACPTRGLVRGVGRVCEVSGQVARFLLLFQIGGTSTQFFWVFAVAMMFMANPVLGGCSGGTSRGCETLDRCASVFSLFDAQITENAAHTSLGLVAGFDGDSPGGCLSRRKDDVSAVVSASSGGLACGGCLMVRTLAARACQVGGYTFGRYTFGAVSSGLCRVVDCRGEGRSRLPRIHGSHAHITSECHGPPRARTAGLCQDTPERR